MEQLGSLPIGEIPRTLAVMLINEVEKKKLQAGCGWRMWRDEAGKTAPNYSLLTASRKTLDSPPISGGCSFRLSQPQLLLDFSSNRSRPPRDGNQTQQNKLKQDNAKADILRLKKVTH